MACISALKLPSRPYSAQISSIRISLSPFEPDITLERQSKAVSSLTNRHENRPGMYNIYSLYMLYFVQVKLYNFWPKMSFEVVVGAFLSVFTWFFLAVEVEWPVDSNIRLIFEFSGTTFDYIAYLAHSFHEDLYEHNGAKLECRPRSLSLTSEDYFMSTIDNFNFVFL